MITAWTKNLSDTDEIEKFQQSVRSSIVLDRMHEILNELKTEQERVELSREAYDQPNWDYKQAHRNGFVSCLTQLMQLTNPDQRK